MLKSVQQSSETQGYPHNNHNLNLVKTIQYELTGYSWSFIFCVKGKSDRADIHRSQQGKLCSIEESLRYIIDMVFFFSINQNILKKSYLINYIYIKSKAKSLFPFPHLS